MEVGDLLHSSRNISSPCCTASVSSCLFFVIVISQDEAQKKTWHDNVSNPKHREVASCGTAENTTLKLCISFIITKLLEYQSTSSFKEPSTVR